MRNLGQQLVPQISAAESVQTPADLRRGATTSNSALSTTEVPRTGAAPRGPPRAITVLTSACDGRRRADGGWRVVCGGAGGGGALARLYKLPCSISSSAPAITLGGIELSANGSIDPNNKRLSAVLEQIKVQQAAYPARQQRGHVARRRPPNNLEAPGLPSKGRAGCTVWILSLFSRARGDKNSGRARKVTPTTSRLLALLGARGRMWK